MDAVSPSDESPIETAFREAIEHRFRQLDVALEPQVEAVTPWGSFRFDFMLRVGGRRLAIECDGREFHNEGRDEWRDAVTLGTRCADEVWRFPGGLIHRRIEVCLLLLAIATRDIGEEFERVVRVCATSALDGEESISETIDGYRVLLCEEEWRDSSFAVMRRTREQIAADNRFFCTLWRAAQAAGPRPLDEVIAAVVSLGSHVFTRAHERVLVRGSRVLGLDGIDDLEINVDG